MSENPVKAQRNPAQRTIESFSKEVLVAWIKSSEWFSCELIAGLQATENTLKLNTLKASLRRTHEEIDGLKGCLVNHETIEKQLNLHQRQQMLFQKLCKQYEKPLILSLIDKEPICNP